MTKKFVLITAAKNEALYVEEWIHYHAAIGVTDFLIFDNDSTDGTTDVIRDTVTSATVRLRPWHTTEGRSPQLDAFNAGLALAEPDYEFGAFIDIDEFIVPVNGTHFPTWLDSIPDDVSAVALCQRVFGSSGLKHYEPRPVLERFVRSSAPSYRENLWFKSLYRLSEVEQITDCHTSPIVRGRYAYPNFDDLERDRENPGKAESVEGTVLQLHHYIIKSFEEFQDKRARGGGAAATLAARLSRYEDDDFFTGRDAYINTVVNENALAARGPRSG